jgi:uncharacterized protein involved in exopolysaccharide biosynthesis
MEEEVKGISDYLDILRRRIYLIVIPAIIFSAISALVAYTLPPTYKSQGVILIESQEIPDSLIKSTVTSYAAQRIEIIKQKIMTTAKVLELVEKHNLYPDIVKNSAPSVLVDLFRENIEVKMVEANVTDPTSGRAKKASIAFTVAFQHSSPTIAQQIANELVTQFLNENVKTRTNRAAETTKFLADEGDKFEKKVQLLEKKIADFKDEFSDSLPELLEYNLSMVTNLQQELANNQNQIMVLKDQIVTMSLEMSNIPPYLDSHSVNSYGSEITSAQQELANMKAELARLATKYSDSHPDILQIKKRISALESETTFESDSDYLRLSNELEAANVKLRELKQRYSDSHPDIQSVSKQIASLERELSTLAPENTVKKPKVNDTNRVINPIYLQIKSKIDSSEREINRLIKRQDELNSKLKEFEARVYQTHQVKRAYDDLTRDHANNLEKYRELRAKQLEAELAQNLESENKGESFTLIEPPQVSNKAVKPNRPKLLAVGVIGSFGFGIGLALLTELLFGGVRGYNEIKKVTGQNPIVVLPVIQTVNDQNIRRNRRLRMFVLLFIALVSAVLAFHFFVMDLEILWYRVMRKIALL